MDHKLLIDLPAEILITILYRLPPKTIISCKCVCKSLLHLLETPDFVKFHLSKSIPGLVVYSDKIHPRKFKIIEFKEELDLKQHELNYVPVAELDCREFNTPHLPDLTMLGSANGLLLLFDRSTRPRESLYICNPMTREYINLPNPEYVRGNPKVVTYGFGVSKNTDRYKVVRTSHPAARPLLNFPKSECHVYTLGTGSWRSVPHCYSILSNFHSYGKFLNGNVHWLVSELKGSVFILCFDLETEQFKGFSIPHLPPEGLRILREVEVLEDRLCLCYNTSGNEIVVWVMKEYGVEKSWTKGFVINKLPDYAGEWCEFFRPIKVFGDGGTLLLQGKFHLAYYSNETKTILNVNILNLPSFHRVLARLHVSSFLSLKRFLPENVSKF